MIEERHSHEKVPTLEVYTDGSLKRSGPTMTFGAWGFIVVQFNNQLYTGCGSVYDTTNQRMELQAIRNALIYVSSIRRPNDRVVIYSDSAYAINCYLQGWHTNWLNNGWINSKGQEVANRDLWTDIIPFFNHFWYHFTKVPAHSNNFWNNKCDEMVQYEAEYLKTHWRGTDNG